MTHEDERLQAALQARFADKKDMSGKIGETSRFIAFGVVALVFTIHGEGSELFSKILTCYGLMLNVAGLFACLSIMSDYLQYFFGYFSVNDAIRRKNDSYRYDNTLMWYKGRSIFFWLKQFLSFLSAILVVFTFAASVVTP